MKSILLLGTREELRMRLECERLRDQIAALRKAEGLDRPRELVARREEVTDQAEQGMDQAEWDRLHIQELAASDRLLRLSTRWPSSRSIAMASARPVVSPSPKRGCGLCPPHASTSSMRPHSEHEAALEERIHAEEQLPESGF